jgi:hypothetical protein
VWAAVTQATAASPKSADVLAYYCMLEVFTVNRKKQKKAWTVDGSRTSCNSQRGIRHALGKNNKSFSPFDLQSLCAATTKQRKVSSFSVTPGRLTLKYKQSTPLLLFECFQSCRSLFCMMLSATSD